MPGMLAHPTRLRVTETTGIGSGDYLPDLTDPATLGCLLALVREAYGTQGHARMVGHRWRYEPGSWYECQPTHDTEAEALVAALEAAP